MSDNMSVVRRQLDNFKSIKVIYYFEKCYGFRQPSKQKPTFNVQFVLSHMGFETSVPPEAIGNNGSKDLCLLWQ